MNKTDTLTILCGGKSRRMGQDKALLTYHGETLLARHIRLAKLIGMQVLVATGGNDYDLSPTITVIADKLPQREGPLSALVGALTVCKQKDFTGTWLLPIDTLITPAQLIQTLTPKLPATGAIIMHEGRPQPLFAWYSVDILTRLEQWLADGIRQMTPLAAVANIRHVAMPENWLGRDNFNTSEQWQHAQQTMAQQSVGDS